MKQTQFRHSSGKYSWTCREWSCCGKIWQLLLSRNFPDRYTWKPICPVCGSVL